MAERKTLTITQVNEIQKVGDKQIPKLSFRAREGDSELTYFTFKTSLFDLIKEGQTINADIETEIRGDYTNRKVVQIYVDGQPVATKRGYQGKSPEELELSARSYVLSYAKDLVVADKIPLEDITKTADWFYTWLKVTDKIIAPPIKESPESDWLDSPQQGKPPPKIQDLTEFKGLMADHKIGTHEVCVILSINKLSEIEDYDKAWAMVGEAKKIK